MIPSSILLICSVMRVNSADDCGFALNPTRLIPVVRSRMSAATRPSRSCDWRSETALSNWEGSTSNMRRGAPRLGDLVPDGTSWVPSRYPQTRRPAAHVRTLTRRTTPLWADAPQWWGDTHRRQRGGRVAGAVRPVAIPEPLDGWLVRPGPRPPRPVGSPADRKTAGLPTGRG